MKGFTLDAATLAIITGVIIPLVTGLVTKINASSVLKSVVTLFLSALAGWFAVAQAGVHYDWKDVVLAIFYSWGTAIVSYYGFTSRVGAPQIQRSTAGFGLGPSQ